VDIQAKHQEEINSIHQSYNKRIEELNAKVHEMILSFKPNESSNKKKSKTSGRKKT
jgi:hypothetical protein